MSKKSRKKKMKRTPQQLQKIHEKRMMIEERNRVKRELELKQKLEKIQLQQLETEKNILNQLTEEDWNDCYYHITQSHKWDIISKEGLKGGKGDKWGDGFGFLYLTDSDDKKLWNGIGVLYVMDFNIEGTHNDKLLGLYGDKNLSVLCFPKKVLELMDLPILLDNGGECVNYDGNHKKVQIGSNVIPSKVIRKVYDFRTDTHRFETEDRWDYLKKHFQLRYNEEYVPMEELSYTDVYGTVGYEERYEKTTKHFLSLPYEEKKRLLDNVDRERIMNGTSSFFNKEVQTLTEDENPYILKNLYSEVI